MCARITLLTYDELLEVASALEARRPFAGLKADGANKRLQAFPGSSVNALAPDTHGLAAQKLTWGFTAPDGKSLVFNTRIETALGGSRMWQEAFQQGRCILPVATFFEPHATQTMRNPHTGRNVKQQYEFASAQGEPLLLASIQQEGRLSVLTTEPNENVSPIHARMPLALSFEEVEPWLEGHFASLANRSRIHLVAAPEITENQHDQLSLF